MASYSRGDCQRSEETAPLKEDRLTAGEAWEMVLKAIRKYGVLYGTKEAEASLPRKVLKAVNAIGGLKEYWYE